MEKRAQPEVDCDDFSSEGDNEETSFLNTAHAKETARKRGMTYLLLANLFVFMMSTLTLVCAVYSQRAKGTYVAAGLMDEFSIFSPAMHVVEYEHTQFQLPNPINSSKYVGSTDDAAIAWMDIALPDQMVSVEDFPKLRKPTDSLKVTDPKTGETGYRVGLEVSHQLQCLNLLRMATYPEYYAKLWSSDVGSKPDVLRVYLDECVEILRMNLMCHADVNVFTFHTVPGTKGAWPDYESHHVCRNFDKIKKWANNNAMPNEKLYVI